MLDISGLKAYQAELQRERDFSGKDSEQHAEPDPGRRHCGTDQLRQSPLEAMGYEQQAILGAASRNSSSPHRSAVPSGSLLGSPRRQPGGQSRTASAARRRPRRAILRQPQPHARRTGPGHQHRSRHERRHRRCLAAGQADARREDGRRRTAGFRRRTRSQQSRSPPSLDLPTSLWKTRNCPKAPAKTCA